MTSQNHRNKLSLKKRILGTIAIILFLVLGYLFFIQSQNSDNNKNDSNFVLQEPVVVAPEADVAPEDAPADFEAVKLQGVLDSWEATTSGITGVVITDKDGRLLAQLNGDKKFFTASIYKIYVAYEGYKQLDAGTIDPSEVYVNGHTRLECLDIMIRESDSPCSEKLWNEIGKQKIEDAIIKLGITDTSMTGLSTTAGDAAKMLKIIWNGEGLSESSKNLYLASMENQIFRSTLNKSFQPGVKVYNKIGFNGQKEYHDTAIVEFEDGRVLIVSVLTDGVGTKNIVKLGTMLENSITKPI